MKSLVIAILVVTVVSIFVIPTTQQVKAGPLEAGQGEAEQDFINSAGQDKDPDCNAENGVDWCTLYKLGYNTRWMHMESVYDCSSGVCQ